MTGDGVWVRTARQRELVALADSLGQSFAAGAAAADRDNRFPAENFAVLSSSGYAAMTVPREFGGGGATLLEMVLAQERLARYDAATALGIGWHVSLIGKQAEVGTWPEAHFSAICQGVVADGVLINSAASERETGSPSRGGRPTTTAVSAADGWVLSGRKAYLSLAPSLTYAVVSAGIDGEADGGWFLVPLDAPGVAVDETWDMMGMRATGSHDLVLDGVALPRDALLERFGPGHTCPVAGAGAGWGLHIPAVYVGIAHAARDFILDYARQRQTSALAGPLAEQPRIQLMLGQIEQDLLTAQSLLFTLADRWDAAPELRETLVPMLGAAKVVATNKAIDIVDCALRIAGIAGMSRALPLERLYRDVRAGLSNPPMEDSALAKLAQAALWAGGDGER